MPYPLQISYLLAALAVPVVLYFHLLPAVFAGLAVHVLTVELARRLPDRWGAKSHTVALAGIVLIVMLLVFGICLGLWSFLQGHHGVADLLVVAAERVENLKRSLPPDLASSLPDTVEEMREQLAGMLREHGKNISHIGMSGLKTFAHIFFGMVIGGIAVLQRFQKGDDLPPLSAGLHARLLTLAEAFHKVVFAQVKISSLNTVLTGIYILGILPFFDVQLPMASLLVLLTFIAGLLPVVGNLISNSIIVLISLGISPGVGGASLAFLILVHKLEYFTNARIVGGEVKAGAWELLSAMLVMEAIFGMAGMVAAPVVYAWLKAELKALELV
jgi:predicted PurR-regulated permease PerM